MAWALTKWVCKQLFFLAVSLAVFISGWNLRGHWDKLEASHKVKLPTPPAEEPYTHPCSIAPAPSAPHSTSSPSPVTHGLPKNTDGGHIPWNGGDLYMSDYSGILHPKDGTPEVRR